MRTVAEPLLKVTLNLYAKDVEWFKRRFKYGYQEQIREALRAHIKYIEAVDEHS
jgi:uncharacterized protein (DUF4415 family)